MHKQHRLWLDEFLQNCRDSNKSKHTLINYRSDLYRFIAWFEHSHKGQTLDASNAQTITDYTSHLTNSEQAQEAKKKKKISKNLLKKMQGFFGRIWGRQEKKAEIKGPLVALAVSSRRRHLSAIKNFFEYLKQSNEDSNDLFPTNPVKTKLHSIRLKDSDVAPTKLLTENDWKAIESSLAHPRERFIANILYYGGLRLSELSSLELKNFDKEKGAVTFTRKGGYVHTLFIQQARKIFTLLEEHLATAEHKGEYVFTNNRGKALSSRAMHDVIMNIFKLANCPTRGLTPHSFRKACASNLYHKTKDLLLVRDYLNHADAKVTQSYIERIDHITTHAHKNGKGF